MAAVGDEAAEAEPPVLAGPGAAAGAAGLDRLYEREYGSLVGLALALTGSRAVAEELVQEAFLRAHQRWDRVGVYERPGAWVRRVVVNLATSRGRRLAAEARALVRLRAERPAEPVLSAEAAGFWAAVRALPRRQAQAVALYYGEDRPVAEVAEVLACAQGTVRALLHQGRQTLARRLGEANDEEGEK